MFGFGKKKATTTSTLTDERKNRISQALAKMLTIQMCLAPVRGKIEVTPIELRRGHINRKALGYIYGFVDSALRCMGEDISNVSVGVPILYQVLRSLFPGHEQAYTEFLIDHMDDETVVLGMMAGGQQYAEYNKSGAQGAPPMGLARFIVEGQED
jgi:hypothetical protein